MQRTNNYKIQDLVDTSKKIKIVNFYDNSVLFFGYYKDIPERYLKWTYRIFCPHKDYYEFTV